MVRQRHDGDCVPCCLAMWARIGWEEAAGLFPVQRRHGFRHGVSGSAMVRAWRAIGVEIAQMPSVERRLGVLMVDEGSHCHALFWDGRVAWDPRSGRKMGLRGLGAVEAWHEASNDSKKRRLLL